MMCRQGLFVSVFALAALAAQANFEDYVNGMEIDERTAVVIVDPQNDFLSPEGVAWGVVGNSVTENDTVNNIEKLMMAAKKSGIPLFISPHWYFPNDHHWMFEGALEKLMHDIRMFDRAGQLDVTGFEGSGSDWVEQLKPYIEHEDTVVVNPHKIYGPQNNDLTLQLRKRRIDKIILGGMSANLCIESHLRDMVEQGFEVVVVKDATAAAQPVLETGEILDGYKAAVINFKMIASDVWTTAQAVDKITIHTMSVA